MSFEPKLQAFNSSVNAVTLGTGDKAITIGGQNVMPFYTFDNAVENTQKIGLEILDDENAVENAKKAESMQGVDFVCLHLESADPNGADTSVEDCVALAKAVSEATSLPLVIMGCKAVEKDAEIFNKISEALEGKNILVLSAREENYKQVGAGAGLAYGQKVGAESAVDINLAKQLNTMLSQLGVDDKSIVMNAGSAAAGYGYEYVASTLDRIRAAALQQGDAQLAMPIITPVSTESWAVKESLMPEEEMPEWGSLDERIIEMEITTAAAALTGGSDAVIMRHPEAIKTIAAMIAALN
ncbi:MAG: acetyl-CoA decarbonylase/synthase complex subunit delta [Oscillospiraceae bacterium]|nr:acetyl-CoA decarbonylase/synthase complex subunit delta [Candidatus Limimonas coprohippi]MCQ2487953.1 acetyl-CoA decarbonylase/synthase complex subunit delta [Clostridia bacterium]